MLVIFELNIEKFFGIIEGEEIFDVGIDPEFWSGRERFFAGETELAPDATNLVFVDMGVVDDVGHLAGAESANLSQ